MATKTISAQQFNTLLLDEVAQSGEPIIIEVDGKPTAVLVSVEAYKQVYTPEPQLEEIFGMWSDKEDDFLISHNQWRSQWHDQLSF